MIIRATSTTMGQSSLGSSAPSKPYRWRQMPGWEPGHPAYRETTPAPFTAGGAALSTLRQVRIASFGAALRDLGHHDPGTAPPAAVIEAGKRAGVGEKTARKYRAALLKQQRGSVS